MARCKECLHYEVCAKEGRLVQVDEHTWDDYNQLEDVERFCDNYIATADVVPRQELDDALLVCELTRDRVRELEAEVERLQKAYLQYEETTGLRQAKQEVAREIFAEIERTCVDTFGNFYIGATRSPFAELKKKYTGE